MSPFAGPLLAAAALLGIAGVAKLTSPDAARVALRTAGMPSTALVVRVLGVVEVAFAAVAIAVGGAVPAALVTASYLGFAWFSHRLDRASRGTAPCGCFGTTSAPVGRLHVALNLVIAVVVGGAILQPSAGILDATTDTPWAGVPFLALTALLTWMTYVSLTLLPALLDAIDNEAAPT